jgi:hypothetical protein
MRSQLDIKHDFERCEALAMRAVIGWLSDGNTDDKEMLTLIQTQLKLLRIEQAEINAIKN